MRTRLRNLRARHDRGVRHPREPFQRFIQKFQNSAHKLSPEWISNACGHRLKHPRNSNVRVECPRNRKRIFSISTDSLIDVSFTKIKRAMVLI